MYSQDPDGKTEGNGNTNEDHGEVWACQHHFNCRAVTPTPFQLHSTDKIDEQIRQKPKFHHQIFFNSFYFLEPKRFSRVRKLPINTCHFKPSKPSNQSNIVKRRDHCSLILLAFLLLPPININTQILLNIILVLDLINDPQNPLFLQAEIEVLLHNPNGGEL